MPYPQVPDMKSRSYGPFPYRPIHEAPKLTWPDGARVAFLIVPNVEFFPLDMPIPNARPNIPDVSAWGRRDYGNRIGFFRMADLMARLGMRGTVALNSLVCDHCPQVVDKCLELDWELMGHSETNAVLLSDYKGEEEKGGLHTPYPGQNRGFLRQAAEGLGWPQPPADLVDSRRAGRGRVYPYVRLGQ